MREFKLWNHDKTTSFDFKAHGILITDVSGLGIGYAATISNGAVVSYDKEFDQISLLANFGIKYNAYTAFNEFAAFISDNGKKSLILEYSVNERTVYADVWLSRMPKSQKTNFNILSETLTFTRTSYWYTIEEGEIPAAPGFVSVENPVDDNIKITIVVRSTTPANFKIEAIKGATKVVEIIIPNQIISGTLTSDAERKVVERLSDGVITNGYNSISRTGDTFMVLGKGTYKISTNLEASNQPLYRYKKWVLD